MNFKKVYKEIRRLRYFRPPPPFRKKIIKHLLKSLSIPASVIRSEDEIQAKRNEKQQQAQQQQQMQQQMQQAEVAKNTAPMVEAVNQIDTEEV